MAWLETQERSRIQSRPVQHQVGSCRTPPFDVVAVRVGMLRVEPLVSQCKCGQIGNLTTFDVNLAQREQSAEHSGAFVYEGLRTGTRPVGTDATDEMKTGIVRS